MSRRRRSGRRRGRRRERRREKGCNEIHVFEKRIFIYFRN